MYFCDTAEGASFSNCQHYRTWLSVFDVGVRVEVWFLYEGQDVTTATHTHRAEDNKKPQRAPACSSVISEADGSVYYVIPHVESRLVVIEHIDIINSIKTLQYSFSLLVINQTSTFVFLLI